MTDVPEADLAATVRRTDPDRFLSVLFAPSTRRGAAFGLIAFNHELVRAVEMPSARSGAGPIATLIRLQWWREVVEGTRRDAGGHPVASAVRALLDRERVDAATLGGMIDAREAEAEADGEPDVEAWRVTMLAGAGGLQRALGELLQVPAELLPRVAAVGAAYGSGALRRRLAATLRSGRCPLPDALLAEADLDRHALLQDPRPELLPPLSAVLAREGIGFVRSAGRFRLPRERMAAVLPLVLACRDLVHDDAGGEQRGLGDRLAVLRAYASGRAG